MRTPDPADLHDLFRKHQLRITRPRQLILQVLLAKGEHLSAEDIYLKVHRIYPKAGLTTVYRTLELLEGMGILSKLHFGDGRHRYEILDTPSHPGHHHHLICTVCKRAIDYHDFVKDELDLLRRVEQDLARKHGFEVSGHDIQFFGKCSRCRKTTLRPIRRRRRPSG